MKLFELIRQVFAPKPRMTWADVCRMKAEIEADSAEEDRLFGEYYRLPDRPRLKEWRRATEVSEPFLCEDAVDYQHWQAWLSKRRAEAA